MTDSLKNDSASRELATVEPQGVWKHLKTKSKKGGTRESTFFCVLVDETDLWRIPWEMVSATREWWLELDGSGFHLLYITSILFSPIAVWVIYGHVFGYGPRAKSNFHCDIKNKIFLHHIFFLSFFFFICMHSTPNCIQHSFCLHLLCWVMCKMAYWKMHSVFPVWYTQLGKDSCCSLAHSAFFLSDFEMHLLCCVTCKMASWKMLFAFFFFLSASMPN